MKGFEPPTSPKSRLRHQRHPAAAGGLTGPQSVDPQHLTKDREVKQRTEHAEQRTVQDASTSIKFAVRPPEGKTTGEAAPADMSELLELWPKLSPGKQAAILAKARKGKT